MIVPMVAKYARAIVIIITRTKDLYGRWLKMKTPLQMFEEKEQKQCCVQCSKLIEKQGTTQKIYFCGHSGKIILPMFLDCGILRDCNFEMRVKKKGYIQEVCEEWK